MMAGHTEIFRALVDLCKPNPTPMPVGAVATVFEFEKIRNRMLDLYGAAVDHPDFHHCYRLCLDVGGRDSPHLQNLYDFTQLFVNPKVRNLRFESYAQVAPLPWKLPRFKIAVLKWTWKQRPIKGYCPVAPNLAYRVHPTSTTTLREAIDNMEHAMEILTMDVSTVVDQHVGQAETVRWLAEVDIGLVQKLLCVPRTPEEGQDRRDQERLLQKACGEFLAVKLSEMGDFAEEAFNIHYSPALLNHAGKKNEILARTHEVLLDRTLLKKIRAEQMQKAAKAKSVVTDPGLAGLTPTAASLDDRGRVLSAATAYAKPAVEAMPVALRPWCNLIDRELKSDAYKSYFRTACWNVQRQHSLLRQEIAIIRKGSEVMVKTKKAIEARQLVIPLFFRKLSSLYKPGGHIHCHWAVSAAITCTTTELEQLSGIERAENEFDLTVYPEFKVPTAEPGQRPQATKGSDMHPFWAITRMQKKDDKCNCQITRKSTTVVVCAPPGPAGAPALTETFHAHIPYIYNTEDLKPDTQLVLRWHVKPGPTSKPAKKNRTWHTDLECTEKKRARGATAGGA